MTVTANPPMIISKTTGVSIALLSAILGTVAVIAWKGAGFAMRMEYEVIGVRQDVQDVKEALVDAARHHIAHRDFHVWLHDFRAQNPDLQVPMVPGK